MKHFIISINHRHIPKIGHSRNYKTQCSLFLTSLITVKIKMSDEITYY